MNLQRISNPFPNTGHLVPWNGCEERLIVWTGGVVTVPIGVPNSAVVVGSPGVGAAEQHGRARDSHHIDILVNQLPSLSLRNVAVPEENGIVDVAEQAFHGGRCRGTFLGLDAA